MRKIPRELDNPVDNLCIVISEQLSEIFHKFNFSPNQLTTISLLMGLLSLYMYIQGLYLISAVFFFIQYLFDCFDGYYARKYDMVTRFGDYYDHFKDVIIAILIIIPIIINYNSQNNYKKCLPYVLILFFFGSVIHLGCQEVYYGKNQSETLYHLKQFCPTKHDKASVTEIIKYTRFFGTGTFTLYIIFLILFSYTLQ